MRLLPLLIAFMAAVVFAQKTAMPPEIIPRNFTFRDALTIDPNHYRKELENDHLRVLRLNLKADESVSFHEASDGLFVCLRECHLRLSDPGGHVQDVRLEDGRTRWVAAGTRSERNLSTRPVEMLFVEMPAKR